MKLSSKEKALIFFILSISYVPQAYFGCKVGATLGDEFILLTVGLAVLFGEYLLALMVGSYLSEKIISKHWLQIPLLSVFIVVSIQNMIFIWIFSELIDFVLFIDKYVELYIFSQVLSVIIPLLTVYYLSSS
ncbi:MAG: hypothetical protein ACTSX9_04370 [Candidatus Njordarchaeales archaeon]|mgnify:CR=1 FL=1